MLVAIKAKYRKFVVKMRNKEKKLQIRHETEDGGKIKSPLRVVEKSFACISSFRCIIGCTRWYEMLYKSVRGVLLVL